MNALTINQAHPDFLKFLKNEKKTLEWIANNSYITSNFNSLSKSAYQAASNFPYEKYYPNYTYEFNCELVLEIENEIRRTYIEIIVEVVKKQFRQSSYSVSIFKSTKPGDEVIRKIHFDYAIPHVDEDPKPVYHIQYGGEFSQGLTALKPSNVDQILTWLSSPRLYYMPINTALFFDIIFSEFRSDATVKLTEDIHWRELIKDNEDKMLKPFIVNMKDFLGRHKSDCLIRDFYYGN